MTVARPSQSPTWATDTNFTNGGVGIAGTPTKVEPSAGAKAEGDVPGTPYPAQRGNWFKNLVAGWASYFAAIIDSNEEHTYQTAKPRAVRVYPKLIGPGAGWVMEDGNAKTSTHLDPGMFDISDVLRSGQVLTEVSVRLTMGHTEATSTNRVKVRVFKRTGEATHTELTSGGVYAPTSTTSPQSVDPGAFSETVNRVTTTYYVRVDSSTTAGDGGNPDKVHYIDIAYTDNGPRNPS